MNKFLFSLVMMGLIFSVRAQEDLSLDDSEETIEEPAEVKSEPLPSSPASSASTDESLKPAPLATLSSEEIPKDVPAKQMQENKKKNKKIKAKKQKMKKAKKIKNTKKNKAKKNKKKK